MLRDYKYDEYLDSPQQLAKRIIDRLQEENEITFPIDPFKLLSMNGIVYQFRDFKELEGIYIAPLNQEDIPIVGINYNRPIPRQRFTAAHELCHHIKDRSNEACPIGGHKDAIEKFADQFASELLMPRGYFEAEAQKYLIDGKVTFDDALKLSLHFGVSFESCVFTLAYRFDDGNGRIARVFLNWLFKIKGLPPVYLKYESKERYYDALQCVDLNNDYEQLKEVFFTEIVKTMMQIYDGRRIFED